jgi:hypothetical protein
VWKQYMDNLEKNLPWITRLYLREQLRKNGKMNTVESIRSALSELASDI